MIKINYIELNDSEKMTCDPVQVPIKMGSHQMMIKINTNNKKQSICNELKPKDLIELVLKKCNMKKCNSKTYCVFESFKGIERIVKQNENIIELMKYWNNYFDENVLYLQNETNKRPLIEFVIRKLHNIEFLSLNKKISNKKRTNTCKEKSQTIKTIKNDNSSIQNVDSSYQKNTFECKNLKRKASESDNCIKRFLQIKEFIHSFEYKIISHTSNIKDSIFEKLSNKQSIGIIQYKKQRCEYQKYFMDSYIENAKLIDSLVY